jgi:hypothetical protein
VTINPTTSAALPADVRTSHYYEARATDAAPLVVNGEQEKFLFYRGVADFDVPITAEVLSDGRVHIRNLSRDALRSVILFENRNGAIGYRVLGTVPTEARVSAPKTGARFDDLRRELERALVNAGLYEREAAAMVETWRDSWFEEGMRVFYIVPDADVASILPLSVWPTPARVERVFVGRMDVITPAMLQAVGQALTSDSDDVVERFGRLLDPITDRILARGVSMELQRAIARLKQGAFAKYVSAPRTCQ